MPTDTQRREFLKISAVAWAARWSSILKRNKSWEMKKPTRSSTVNIASIGAGRVGSTIRETEKCRTR